MSASTSAPLSIDAREHRRLRAGARARQSQQIDLFGDERQGALAPAPTWQELPVETRAALTNLMARLILEHVQGRQTGSAMEAGHDL